MSESLLRLMTWLSPSFPVGAFSYSHGLEYAVEAGKVTDAKTLKRWVQDILVHGTGRSDSVLFVSSWQACKNKDGDALKEVVELGRSFVPSAELARESRNQGAAFLQAVHKTWPTEHLAPLKDAGLKHIVYPVAVGAACAAHDIELEKALAAYLHGFAAMLISAGMRLIPLGQSEALQITAALEPCILDHTSAMTTTTLNDLSAFTPLADICSMRHETQTTRLFQS